jgi:hypothetical protein
MLGMRINFNKYDLVSIDEAEDQINILAQIFGYKIRKLLLKYLGVPLHFRKHTKENLQPVIDKITKRARLKRQTTVFCS